MPFKILFLAVRRGVSILDGNRGGFDLDIGSDAGILDGDTVIIQRQDTANDGDIVVALIEDESATLKRFHRRVGNKLELTPENKSLRPLVFEAHQVRIQGVLVGPMRRYQ